MLCALAALALIAGVVQLRVRRLVRRKEELKALVQERTTALEEALHKEERLHHEAEQARETIATQAEELATLDQAKSRFFANISHEFRTPLTLLIGPVKDALDGQHDLSPEQLGVMLRNSERLLRLVEELLDLARFEAGDQKLDAHPHDLGTLVQETVQSFAPLAEHLHVALTCETQALPLLSIDREKLEKVLVNLLSNALKFTPARGSVRVRVEADDRHVAISVQDTGAGIAAEDLPHIFERFYHAEGEHHPIQASTGLGLALAKELVALHEGDLLVESMPGRGSTFTVRLPREVLASSEPLPDTLEANATPLAPAHLEAGGDGFGAVPVPSSGDSLAPSDPGTPASSDGRTDEADRPTVLVIDDNADVRRYVASILSDAYRVLEAEDGKQGLQAAQTHLPDLIITDVMMPELDGYGFARALKLDPMLEGIPVIMLTAKAATEDQVAGLERGVDAYLTKPFERAVLEVQVQNLIALRHRLRARYSQAPSLELSVPPAPNRRSVFEARVREVIAAHLTEEGFSVERLAAEVGLGRSQLSRRLRDEADTSPAKLIRTVRVEQAARLLEERAGNVTEVAYAVGFQSLSHFTRCFRAHFQVPPSAFLQSPSP